MIGVFDSGFGGLTVLAALRRHLPQYDYLFLADSARAPYGARSFDVIHEFTLEAVEWLFNEGCTVVVLACNTASARALRTIQQRHLPTRHPDRRVLGVVRPSVEALAVLPHVRFAHSGSSEQQWPQHIHFRVQPHARRYRQAVVEVTGCI